MARDESARPPAGRHSGMADAGRAEVRAMVLPAWDAFIAQVEAADLDRRSRLPGWRVQEIAVHLGCWPDHTALADLISSARHGGSGAPPDVDGVNARVTTAHRDASREEVLAAIRSYEGAIILVTHDEGAVTALEPDRVLILPDGVEDLWNAEYADLVSLA